LKRTVNKHRRLWIIITAAILLVAVIAGVLIAVQPSSKQVSNKITKEQAQKIIDDTFADIPKGTALSAKYILENTQITVSDVSYGNEKDVIVKCKYNTLDDYGAIGEQIVPIMSEVYGFYTNSEQKIAGNNIALEFHSKIVSYLESAEPISGETTIYIYETTDGMQVHLSDSTVNTVTGGLLDVIHSVENVMEVVYHGEVKDITNMNTLRTGVKICLDLDNYSSDKPFTGNAIEKIFYDLKDEFTRNFIEKDRYKYLTQGLGNTLAITGLAALTGILLGIIVALIRCTNQLTGKLKIPNLICQLYLNVLRGTPVMVQLLIIFFVILLPIGVDKFTAAVVCFGLNSGAYVAEIVRGGIMSVDKGQIEAGRSLGFNYVQTMVHFVIPQAFKAVLPALANEFITLLKESSVAFYIGIADLTAGGLKIRSVTYSDFMPLIAVALIYLVMVLILTKLVGILERRLAKSDH